MAEVAAGAHGQPVIAEGPPELRELTTEFNRMAVAVRASLEHQRRPRRGRLAPAPQPARSGPPACRLAGRPRRGCGPAHLRRASRATVDQLQDLLDQLLRLARAEETSSIRRAGTDPRVGSVAG